MPTGSLMAKILYHDPVYLAREEAEDAGISKEGVELGTV
jgi:hypothetical protein